MKRTRINPINAQPQPLAGRQLPANWKESTRGRQTGEWSIQMIDTEKLESAWKNPQWSAKTNSENLIQAARLSTWEDVIGQK